jgi:hypothetical protein
VPERATQFCGLTFEGHAFPITPAIGGQSPRGLLPVNHFFNNPTTAAAMNHRFTVTQQALPDGCRYGLGTRRRGHVRAAVT